MTIPTETPSASRGRRTPLLWATDQHEPEDDDPVIDRMRRDWRNGEYENGRFDPAVFELDDSVGQYKTNDRRDVAKVQLLLDRAGAYDLTPTDGPTGYFGASQRRAIMDYQRANGLTADGWIGPNGETVQSLGGQLDRLKALNEAAAAETGLPLRRPRVETQVAMLPLALGAAALPLLAPAAARIAPALSRLAPAAAKMARTAGGATAGGVIGNLTGDTKEDESGVSVPIAGSQPPNRAARTPPPADQSDKRRDARFEVLADDFAKELLAPVFNSRGNERTQRGDDIVIKQCAAASKVIPEIVDLFEHVGGGHDPNDGTYRKQLHIPREGAEKRDMRGSNRDDVTFGLGGEETYIHVNTVDTLADGVTPNARERRNLERLMRNVRGQVVATIPKLRPGDDEEEYAKMAYGRCLDILREARDKYLKPNKDEQERPDED